MPPESATKTMAMTPVTQPEAKEAVEKPIPLLVAADDLVPVTEMMVTSISMPSEAKKEADVVNPKNFPPLEAPYSATTMTPMPKPKPKKAVENPNLPPLAAPYSAKSTTMTTGVTNNNNPEVKMDVKKKKKSNTPPMAALHQTVDALKSSNICSPKGDNAMSSTHSSLWWDKAK